MTDKRSRPRIREMIVQAKKALQPKELHCKEDRNIGQLEAEVLLSYVLQEDRTWLRAHDDEQVSLPQYKRFLRLVTRRTKHEPIAYIVGQKEFYGHTFKVTKDTLIPRPESELLVELAVDKIYDNRMKVWEVGTGSGAIAISICHAVRNVSIIASDISASALRVARQNAKQLERNTITFVHEDLYGPKIQRLLTQQSSIPIIVANLPYLPVSDKRTLRPDVVGFEPSSALFSGSKGLTLIKKFLTQIKDLHFSYAFLEYDPPQTKELQTLTAHLFPKAAIKIHQDLAGRDRVLEIKNYAKS